MTCPNCGGETLPGQRFCPACGTRLAVVCRACGTPLPEGAAFCPACGAAVTVSAAGEGGAAPPSAAAPGPVAERRLVSVLFCDLVGFTSASQARDAEETRELLARYYDMCRERVARYGGTIEKFVGDAVMAVWGVPTSHEDDAERAVRAALELVAQVPAVLADSAAGAQARAAVMTGEAAVTLGAEGQGMVAGDLVNTAARLQSLAEPGAVLVGESTYRAAERGIAFEEVGEKEVRGRDLPVLAWRAVRVVAGRGGRILQDELEPPFVGRELELRLLDELFRATRRERRLRLVSVTGQAGIGKSRLAREFEKHIDGLVETVYWHQGRCLPYGDGVTYWALAEMVRRRCRIAENEDPQSAGALIRQTLEQFVPEPGERERIGHALRALLGLETIGPGPSEQGELYVLWRTFFERIAGDDSAVLVFEDLQWADEGLMGFIEHLLEFSRTTPILVVTLARPELLDARPTWGAGLRNFTSLHLEPLPEEAMRQLLDGMVPGLPGPARALIVQRAEGVPLYAVETVRMLVADGTLARTDGRYRLTRTLRAPAVPETLRGLIAARLDALEPSERALLQDASVLGHSFTLDALAAVTGEPATSFEPALADLVRREFLRLERDPVSPERGQYQFVQDLVREVAYATLARRDRRARHLAAARHYESLGDESLAGVLADHYLEAWRSAPVGPERDALAAQARVALRGAAERAGRLFSPRQEAAFLERLIDVANSDAERAEIHESIGEALADALANQEAREHLRLALDWARASDDRTAAVRLTAELARSHINELQLNEAVELLEPVWAEVEERVDDPPTIMLAGQLARAWMLMGDDRAVPLADRVIAAADRAGLDRELVETLTTKGTARMRDSWVDGVALLFGAIALARRFSLAPTELRAINNLAVWMEENDPASLEPLVADAIALCERTGREVAGWLPSVARFRTEEGRFAEAMAQLDEADEVLTDASLILQSLGERHVLLALLGRFEELREAAGRREEFLKLVSSREYFDADQSIRALVAILEGRLDEAAGAAAAVGHENAGSTGSAYRAHAHSSWAALLEHDAAGARLILEAMRAAGGERSPVRRAYLRSVEAGLIALEGRTQEAIAATREAIASWAATGTFIEPSIVQVTLLSLLPRGLPETEAMARALHDRWAPLDAPGFMAFMEREMARPPVALASPEAAPPAADYGVVSSTTSRSLSG